eukprot:gene40801-49762_t
MGGKSEGGTGRVLPAQISSNHGQKPLYTSLPVFMASMKISERLLTFVGTALKPTTRSVDGGISQPQTSAYVIESQKHIHRADDLLQDCEKFLQSAEQIVRAARQTQQNDKRSKFDPLRMANSLTKWRVKKRGGKVFQEHEALLARLSGGEKEVKMLIDSSLQDCATLGSQSEYILQRLAACVAHNERVIASLAPGLQEVKILRGALQKERDSVACMLVFFDEVARIKEHEVVPYVPWAQRVAEPTITVLPLRRERLARRGGRLDFFLKVLDALVHQEAPRLRKAENNLAHCLRSLKALRSFALKVTHPLAASPSPSAADLTRLSEENASAEAGAAVTMANPIRSSAASPSPEAAAAAAAEVLPSSPPSSPRLPDAKDRSASSSASSSVDHAPASRGRAWSRASRDSQTARTPVFSPELAVQEAVSAQSPLSAAVAMAAATAA